MANNVDDRTVRMHFDNAQFEQGVQKSINTIDTLDKKLQFKNSQVGLKGIQKSLNNIDTSQISRTIDFIGRRFSTMGIVGMEVTRKLTDVAMKSLGKVTSGITNTINQIKSGGSSRALNLEQARFMLKGLTGDLNQVEKIISGPVNDAVSGTRFGLDAAAVAAANLYASGVTGSKELTKSLQAISGAATMTNREYGDMADIFATIKSNGKLMTMQLRQFSSMGMNVSAQLATELGKSEQQINEMVEKGKISYDQFVDVMYKYWDLAADANSTYAGSLANVNAQLSKIGEVVATKYYASMIKVNTALIDFLKAIKLELAPLYKVINGGIDSVTKKVANFVSNEKTLESVRNLIKGITNIAKGLQNAMYGVKEAFDTAFPKSLSSSLLNISKQFKKVTKAFKEYYSLGEGGKILKNVKSREKYSQTLKDILERYKAEKKVVSDNLKISSFGLKFTSKEIKQIKEKVKSYDKETAKSKKRIDDNTKIAASLSKLIKKYDLEKRTITDNVKLQKDDVKFLKEKLKYTDQEIKAMSSQRSRLLSNIKAYIKEQETQQETLTARQATSKQLHDILKRYKQEKTALGDKIKMSETDAQHVKNAFGNRAKTIYQLQSEIEAYDKVTASMKENAKEQVYHNTTIGKTIDIFDGLFSIVRVAKEAFDGFLVAVSPVADRLKAVRDVVLEIGSVLGAKLFDFNNGLLESNSIMEFAERVSEAIDDLLPTADSIREWGYEVSDYLLEVLPSFDNVADGFTNFKDSVKSFFDKKFDFGWFAKFKPSLETFSDFVIKVFSGIGEILKAAAGGIGSAINELWTMIEPFVDSATKKIEEFLGRLDGKDLVAGLNLGLFTAITSELYTFFNRLNDSASNISWIPSKIKGVLGDLSLYLKNMQAQVDANVIKTIAISVGILAASMVALSMIDSKKLASSLGVMAGLFVELGSAFKVMKGMGFENKGILSTSAALIMLSLSMLIMSGAIAALSAIDPERIGQGLAAFTFVLSVMIGALSVISIMEGSVLSGAAAIVIMANAMVVLAGALALFSSIDINAAAQGLLMMALSLGVLVAGLMALSTVGPVVLAGAAAILLVSVAMIALGGAIAIFSALGLEKTAQGLFTMAGALTILCVALGLLASVGPMVLSAAGGLLITSVALIALGGAIAIFAAIDLESAAGGLGIMAVTLLTLCVALAALANVGPLVMVGAAGLLIASVALIALGAALMIIAAVPMQTLAAGLIFLAAGMLPLAAAAMLIQPALVPLAAFAGILALLAVTIVVVGAGMLILGIGFTTLASALLLITPIDIAGIAAGLLELAASLTVLLVPGVLLIPVSAAILALSVALVAIASTIIIASSGILIFAKAIKTVSKIKLKSFNKDLKEFSVTIASMKDSVKIVYTLAASMNMLSQTMPAVTVMMMRFAVAAVNMASVLSNIDFAPLAKQFASLPTIVSASVQKTAKSMQMAGAIIVKSISTGIAKYAKNLTTGVGRMMQQCVVIANRQTVRFIVVGQNMVNGIILGIRSKQTALYQAAYAIGINAKKAAMKALDEHSPSKVFFKIGAFVIDGFINGVNSKTKAGRAAINKFFKSLGDQLSGTGLVGKSNTKLLDKYTKKEEKLTKTQKRQEKQLTRTTNAIIKRYTTETYKVSKLNKEEKKELKTLEAKDKLTLKEKKRIVELRNQETYLTRTRRSSRKFLTKNERAELLYLQKKLKLNGELSNKEYKRLGTLLGLNDKQQKQLEKSVKTQTEQHKALDKTVEKLEKTKAITAEIAKSVEKGDKFDFVFDNAIMEESNKILNAFGEELYKQTDEYKENTAQIKANKDAIKNSKETIKELNAEKKRYERQLDDENKTITKLLMQNSKVSKLNKEQSKELSSLEKKYEKNGKLTDKEWQSLAKLYGWKEKDVKAIKSQYKEMKRLEGRLLENGKLSDENTLRLAELYGIRGKNLDQIRSELMLRADLKNSISETNGKINDEKEDIKELKDENKNLADTIQNGTVSALEELRNTIKDNIENAINPFQTAISNSIDLLSRFSKTAVDFTLPFTVEEFSSEEDLAKAQAKAEKIAQLQDMGFKDYVIDQLKEQNESTIDKYLSMTKEEVDYVNHAMQNNLIGNLRSFGDAYREFEELMVDVSSKNFTPALLDRLYALGPEGVNVIRYYADMTEEEVEQANAAILHSTSATLDQWLAENERKIQQQKDFYDNLDILRANGLSDEAYQGLMKEGFNETTSAIVDGLLNGTESQFDRVNAIYADFLSVPEEVANQATFHAAVAGRGVGTTLFDGIFGSLEGKLLSEDERKKFAEALSDFVAVTTQTTQVVVSEQTEEAAKTTGEEYIDGMSDTMKENKGEVSKAGKSVGKAGKKGVETYLSKANGEKIGRLVDDGLASGLYSNMSKVTAAAREVARAAYDAAMSELDIESPSKKFAEIGMYVDLGFAKGINDYTNRVTNASINVADSSMDAVRGAVERLNEIISGDNVPVIKPILDLSNVEAGAYRMKRMFNQAHVGVEGHDNVNKDDTNSTTAGNSYQFVQNNYSPKALSRIDIYRQTRNQFAMLKGATL